MSLLNRPSDGLPSVLIAIFRTLRAYGPMPESELIELVAPATAVKQDMAKKTLTRWKQLGFIALAMGPLCRSLRRSLRCGVMIQSSLRTEILRLIFSKKTTRLCFSMNQDEDVPSGSADLCSRACLVSDARPFHLPKESPLGGDSSGTARHLPERSLMTLVGVASKNGPCFLGWQ